jgi:hypothetical protein
MLGLVPSNHLIRLQFESSTGIHVPDLVPDGAQTGPAGGCRLKTEAPVGDPTCAPRSLPWAAASFTRQALGTGRMP